MRIAFVLVSLSLVTMAFAEPTVPQRSGPYLGVQPGMRDVAPNTKLRGANKRDNALTWVGFDMTAPGGRVFLQTSSPAKYQVLPTAEDEVVIQIKNCALNWKNDGHHLDTAGSQQAPLSTFRQTQKRSTARRNPNQTEKGWCLRPSAGRLVFFVDTAKAD